MDNAMSATIHNKHPFRCEHLVRTNKCEECRGAMTPAELGEFLRGFHRYRYKLCAAKKARLSAANEELKAQESPAAGSPRKVLF